MHQLLQIEVNMGRFTSFQVVVLFLLSCSPCSASERYFVLMFGSQRKSTEPELAHSFATFIKVTETPAEPAIQHHSISWLPVSGEVRFMAVLPEPGRQYELHETIEWALASGARVSAWGPYETQKDLYDRSVRQMEKFERWGTKYKANDVGYPNFLVTNCIHALSSVAGINRMRVASPSWGETASYWIIKRYQLQRFLLNPRKKHCWLVPQLGIQHYPIRYRELEPPRTGVLWSFLLGEEDCE
jgi:hypothetical protein